MVNIGSAIPKGTLQGISNSAMPSRLEITTTTYPTDPVTGEPLTDPYGYPLPGVTTITTTRCRLSGLSSDESVIAGRISSTATAKITAPLDTPIEGSNTVEVDGEPWNVVGVMPRSAGLAAHKVVLVARSS